MLIIELRLTDGPTRTYLARNLTAKGKFKGWNTYEISKPPEEDGGTGYIIGTLRHKYEDGADVLALKALKLVTGRKKK